MAKGCVETMQGKLGCAVGGTLRRAHLARNGGGDGEAPVIDEVEEGKEGGGGRQGHQQP